MKMRSSWLGGSALVLLAGLSFGRLAHAQPAEPAAVAAPAPAEIESPTAASTQPSAGDCIGERFLVLVASGFEPALAAEVRMDFATELAHRGLGLCEPKSTTREPAAVMELSADANTVLIALDDRLTHKRVARDLSLAGIPQNGRALAIAIASDELLRASWAELTLRRPRDAEDDVDESAYRVSETRRLDPGDRPREQSRYHLGADVGFLHTARNFDAFALDLRGSLRPWGWGWFELGLGGLGSVPAHSALGDVVVAGFRSSLTAGACARRPGTVFGCAGVRGELDALRLRGLNADMARARRQAAVVVQSSLVGLLAVTLRRDTYLFGELALGAVLQGAEATDGTRTLVGVTGMIFSLSLGLGYEL